MEKKMTKRDYYEVLQGVVAENVADEEKKDMLIEFLQGQIVVLDKKADKAKERAAEKKAQGDELRAAVQSVLTNELQTADEILAQIEGEELTKAKITARLSALCREEIATKEDVKTEDGRKIKAYKLISE